MYVETRILHLIYRDLVNIYTGMSFPNIIIRKTFRKNIVTYYNHLYSEKKYVSLRELSFLTGEN